MVLFVGYLLIHLKVEDNKFNWTVLGSMLVIFFLIALIWIKIVPNNQISDFGNFWLRAPGIFKGDKLYYTDNDYFAKYAYQTGFMIYILGIIKVFGYNVFIMQFLNIIYQTVTLLLVYLITNRIFHNIRAARLSVFLLMINLDWFALNSQADNQYLGSMFYLLTIYLLMKNKMWSYILAGFTLTGGCLIRPIGPVFIAGIIVYALIFILLRKKDYRTAIKYLLTLVIYLCLFLLVGIGVKSSGLNNYGLSNHDPGWKFLTGLSYQSGGTYSPDMDKFTDLKQSLSQTKHIEKKQLHKEISYLNESHSWIKLFLNKTQTLWASRTQATDFSQFNKIHSSNSNDLVNYIAYCGTVSLIIFSWIGSIMLIKIKFSNKLYILLLPLMAFAIVQLFIEVQGRYRIEFLPIISILAGVGFYYSISTSKVDSSSPSLK